MTKRSWLLLVLAAVVVLGLAACSSNEGTTDTPAAAETEETAPAAVEDETQAVVPVDETTEPSPEPELLGPALPAETDEEAVLPPEGAFSGATAALAELDSYRYSTMFTFVSEDDGETEAGSIELTGIVAGPSRKHLIWRDLGEDEQFEVIQIDNQAWVFDDDEWEEAPVLVAEAMSQAVLIYAPSIAWGGIFGEVEPTATYVGKETVNGVSAHHYTSTYEQWGGYWQGALENASGDVWIAEAGYPVKYHFSATGVDEDGARGAVTWTMDLTDVGTEITIEPPLESPAEDAGS
ncbi:MAG: hypothetical protein WBC63_01630 [Candidatus Bipolaricaulia bacterium]